MDKIDINEAELKRLVAELVDAVRSLLGGGYFELNITGEIVKGGKRRVKISGGKSRVFHLASPASDK